MRIEWLNKDDSDRVVVFFNGWGMDATAVAHLKPSCNVAMLYDYRTLDDCPLQVFESFKEITIVAWSMGVWAASVIVPDMKKQPVACYALNGTERPVNDEWGIPYRIYLLTERGMNEQGRDRFLQRMINETEEQNSILKSHRGLSDVCEELSSIRKQSTGTYNEIKWNKVYVSDNDVIFPVANQLKWWEGKAPVEKLAGGHYPFYHFKTWEEITTA